MRVVKMQFSIGDMLSAQKYHLTHTHIETIEYFLTLKCHNNFAQPRPSPQPPHNELLNDM